MITARSLAASAIYDLLLLKQKEKAQAEERGFVRRSRVCQLESEERQVCVPERARPDVIGNITRQRFKVQVISQYHPTDLGAWVSCVLGACRMEAMALTRRIHVSHSVSCLLRSPLIDQARHRP